MTLDPEDLVHPALVRDLLSWVAHRPRPYAEMMEAWRSSCPQLTIWEDALDCGLIERAEGTDGRPVVRITSTGRRYLGGS